MHFGQGLVVGGRLRETSRWLGIARQMGLSRQMLKFGHREWSGRSHQRSDVCQCQMCAQLGCSTKYRGDVLAYGISRGRELIRNMSWSCDMTVLGEQSTWDVPEVSCSDRWDFTVHTMKRQRTNRRLRNGVSGWTKGRLFQAG